MRILTGICIATLFAINGASAEWAEFVDQEQYFSINFPGTPEVAEIEYPSEYGVVLPAKAYSYETNGIQYRVTVVDYNQAAQIYEELPDRTDEGNNKSLSLYDTRGSIAYAAHNIRARGGEVTYDAWHHIDLVEGHQLQITNEDKSRLYAGIYLHGGRTYIVEASVPEGGLPQGLFQQSLSFIDEDGIRIRYRLYPDGSRERGPLP